METIWQWVRLETRRRVPDGVMAVGFEEEEANESQSEMKIKSKGEEEEEEDEDEGEDDG